MQSSNRVLIVDDESVARGFLRHTLEREGYAVEEARDGIEALAALKRSPCQMIISDWDMPGINGLDLCRTIRSAPTDRYIYFILLTSHDSPQDVLDGLDAGADDFITKPFNPAEVTTRLRAGQRLLSLQSAEMTIFVLARLAESRDPETGAHLERVREYCRLLAQRLQQSEANNEQMDHDFANLIYQTSPLHDIGKVAIPDRVLLKPGKLSSDEFETMKTHTLEGASTLGDGIARFPNARFLHMAREIALTHHEKYNGEGYPAGLRGDEIPLAGRIVAVADVYDALTSARVYKDAFPHERAHAIIMEEAGGHFDPRIVEVYEELQDEFRETASRFTDKSAPPRIALAA